MVLKLWEGQGISLVGSSGVGCCEQTLRGGGWGENPLTASGSLWEGRLAPKVTVLKYSVLIDNLR